MSARGEQKGRGETVWKGGDRQRSKNRGAATPQNENDNDQKSQHRDLRMEKMSTGDSVAETEKRQETRGQEEGNRNRREGGKP